MSNISFTKVKSATIRADIKVGKLLAAFKKGRPFSLKYKSWASRDHPIKASGGPLLYLLYIPYHENLLMAMCDMAGVTALLCSVNNLDDSHRCLEISF